MGRIVAALLGGAAGMVPGLSIAAQDGGAPQSAAARCHLSPLRREFLKVEGGRRLYVEPSALVESKGRTLLAGTPTYLWRPQGRGLPELERRDSLIGAVIPRRGAARGIAAPLRGRPLRFVRAAARARGGWTIAFAELEAAMPNPLDERVIRLWSGDHDGRRWTKVEPLPLPSSWTPEALEPSAVVTKGDSALWAVPAKAQDGRAGLIVLTRAGSAWRVDTMVTPGFSGVGADYVEGLGFALVVAQFDRSAPSRGPSVALHARAPEWREIARLSGDREPNLREVRIASGKGPPAVAWIIVDTAGARIRQALRVRTGALSLATAVPAFTLDSSAVDYALERLAGGAVLALVHHMQPGQEQRPSLRLIAGVGSTHRILHDMPTPFTGGFAIRVAGTELLIAGAYMRQTEREPFITTLLLRAHIACDDAGE